MIYGSWSVHAIKTIIIIIRLVYCSYNTTRCTVDRAVLFWNFLFPNTSSLTFHVVSFLFLICQPDRRMKKRDNGKSLYARFLYCPTDRPLFWKLLYRSLTGCNFNTTYIILSTLQDTISTILHILYRHKRDRRARTDCMILTIGFKQT